MGNNASSPKASGAEGASPNTTGGRPHNSLQHQTSPTHQQKTARNPALVQNQRIAVPPEPSMAHAQGSTASSASSRSIPSRPYSAAAEAAAAATASPSRTGARPTDIKTHNTPPPPSKPVDVPQPSTSATGGGSARIPIVGTGTSRPAISTAAPPTTQTEFEPPLSPYADSMDVPIIAHNSMQDVSYLTRPPRMPLPIEEEVHTPGSPIIAPRKDGGPVDEIAALDNDGLTHRSSTLSSVTGEDEDMEELRVDKTRPTVPTRLEWLRGGEKVYVTGTIFQWNKKQRMHPVEGRPGVFATTINVLPGTHHIRFLVDNHMETSRDLPTTVDFGNNLVNYIEVAPQSTPPKGQPIAAVSATAAAAAAAAAAAGGKSVAGAQTTQEPPALSTAKLLGADSSVELTNRAPKWKDVPQPSVFSNELPKYLVDYDQPDESPDFASAAAATEILPMPPSLPGFLGKPILNAATLIKDDNSVLNMPNHTILNHLATSSIKNNILAVSATTRYKDKFVTIIIYKPTGGDDKR